MSDSQDERKQESKTVNDSNKEYGKSKDDRNERNREEALNE
jgi:hypothetical protein